MLSTPGCQDRAFLTRCSCLMLPLGTACCLWYGRGLPFATWSSVANLHVLLRLPFLPGVASHIPVLVDSRHVCHSIQVRAAKAGTMHIDAFLTGVGLPLPDSSRLNVTGTCSFDSCTRAITVQSRDVVVLEYSDSAPLACLAAVAPTFVNVGDAASVMPEASVDRASRDRRSRSPCPTCEGPGHAAPAGPACGSSPLVVGTCSLTLWRLLGKPPWINIFIPAPWLACLHSLEPSLRATSRGCFSDDAGCKSLVPLVL